MDGEITPQAVSDLDTAADDLRIVDIRDERSFERGHIPGSVNLPFHELTARVDELTDASHVVTVCPHGKASVQAARLIASYEGCADARVESLAGGLDAWATEYDLVETAGDSDRDEPPL